MKTYLAADIGGTNTQICLVNSQSEIVKKTEIYPSQDNPSIESIVSDFLKDVSEKPTRACFAVAGPVLQGKCKITNLPWEELDEEKLAHNLGLEKVTLINDFVAIGYNIVLGKKEIDTLQEGTPDPNAPVAIMGAGTGLGKTFGIPLGDTFKVFPSEGGHSDYAARKESEDKLLIALRPKYQKLCQEKFSLSQDKVEMLSIDEEAILSGPGILEIFNVLKSDFEASLATEILSKEEKEQAAAIATAATEKTNALAEKTMDVFIEAYGAIAGNLAATLLPFGGLYIAGGIAAKNLDLIKTKKDIFLNAFNHKVRVNPSLLKRVPIHIVTNELSGLNGAINYLKTESQE